ncbi:hypothetical protein [Amycolatopsis sp. NPDC004079]|uniref:hypothetical protein n=1 Tax=Amycolatopsis sp. NPDC004079 TaxID=3154549 RepID=UPI0033A05370
MTILGRPVTGVHTGGNEARVDRRCVEEFLRLVDTILADRTVEAFRWNQYTPFENPGGECLFGADRIEVKLRGGVFTHPDDIIERMPGPGGYRLQVRPEYEQVFAALHDLEEMFDLCADLLKEAFGDHAEITATRDGFDVAKYDNHE